MRWDDYDKDYSDLPPEVLREQAEAMARQQQIE